MVKLREKLNPSEVHRGDIWYADLNPVKGHEQAKRRPVLVIQNDIANQTSPCVTVLPIHTYEGGKVYPTEVLIKAPEGGLSRDSLVLCSQIRTLDKEQRFREYRGRVQPRIIERVEQALKIHLGLIEL
jgi:mRNA interferase MazF